MIYIVLDLCPELVRGMGTCSRKIVTADDWSENLVLLIVLQVGVAVAFYYSYDLLLGAFPRIGRSKSFVGGQRSLNLMAVVGIHS